MVISYTMLLFQVNVEVALGVSSDTPVIEVEDSVDVRAEGQRTTFVDRVVVGESLVAQRNAWMEAGGVWQWSILYPARGAKNPSLRTLRTYVST